MPQPSPLDKVQGDGADDSSAVTDADKGTGASESTVVTTTAAAGSQADKPKDGDAETEPGSSVDDDLDGFKKSYKELMGKDLEGDYDSVDAARAAATAAAGQPDQASDNWHNLMDAARDDPRVLDALKQALRGEAGDAGDAGDKPAPQPVPAGGEMPKSTEELELWRSRLYDGDGKLRSDADPGLVGKMQAYGNKVSDIQFQLATNPGQFFSAQIEQIEKKLLDTSRAETQQQAASRQMQDEYEQIAAQHGDKLFVDGDRSQLTSYGHAVTREYNSLVDDGMSEGPKALQRAIKYAAAVVPAPQKTRRPSSRAGRKPPVAPAADGARDEQQFFDEGGDLVELLELKMAEKE